MTRHRFSLLIALAGVSYELVPAQHASVWVTLITMRTSVDRPFASPVKLDCRDTLESMKGMYVTFGLIAFCLGLVACLSGRKHLAYGDTGVIVAKDTVYGTTDREGYEELTKSQQTDDKVALVQLMVHGKLVKMEPGTKFKVVGAYDYMGTHAYKAEMTEKSGDGADESWKMQCFVNAHYVDAVK